MRRAVLALLIAKVGLVGLFGCAARTHLVADYPSFNADLTINAVIENPAGSDAKWEVRSDGRLFWERNGGVGRRSAYLPWVANGGMIPRTYLDPEYGGDGEPLDVIVLGPAVERGSVVKAFVIGSLKIREELHRDDKILAVMAGSPFSEVNDVEELEEAFPGVRSILETYYSNYAAPGKTRTEGFGSRAAARWLIAECNQRYEERIARGELPGWGNAAQ